MGPSKVGPSYGATFARRYRPPFGVRVWSPNVLTFYVVSVPKMVCFFEVAFDNGLRFPLHPFIKGVLQHFNVCPSQLAPNGWGILVGLLAFFRDRGLGVPSVALLLYLFSPKETAEGFLYFSRRSGAPLVLQHFNVCPSQLAPNGWSILVGLLAFFRDRGLGVPSVALLIYLFTPKETAEGFLYFSRRSRAPLVISDLPSSHRSWKGHYFFCQWS